LTREERDVPNLDPPIQDGREGEMGKDGNLIGLGRLGTYFSPCTLSDVYDQRG